MTSHPRIIIIGAGIGGSTLALFLHKAGIVASVFDAAPGVDNTTGGLQIAPNGMNILSQLDLAEGLLARGVVATGMRFRNSQGNLLSDVQFQLPEKYRYPAVNASRRSLHELLVGELWRREVPMHFSKRLVAIKEAGAASICTFEDSTSVDADVVVGADGLHSAVRAALLPAGPKPEYTGLLAAGGFVDPAALERGSHPPPGTLDMVYGRVGFFGIGYARPAAEEHSMMWWSAIPGEEIPRARLAAMTDADRRTLLLEVHRGWCAPVETAIRHSAPSIFMGNIYDIPRLPRWSRGRVVLMGDAAHAVSPHSGQGASMALEDAISLAGHLRAHLDTPDHAFARFEADRRRRAEQVVEFGRRSGNQKQALGPVGAWVRDRFVALILPTLMRRSADWLYNYQPAWP
jgi:2-polyprenyl-6-methoxyphenol hydroxylase-like FAD-dependent oxidoreductase